MSRSYKKTPYSGDRQNKEDKQIANRKIRREKINYNDDDYEVLKHKAYRKKNESYDIRDYGIAYISFDEYKKGRLETWTRFSKDKGIAPPTEEEMKKDYDKLFRRK